MLSNIYWEWYGGLYHIISGIITIQLGNSSAEGEPIIDFQWCHLWLRWSQGPSRGWLLRWFFKPGRPVVDGNFPAMFDHQLVIVSLYLYNYYMVIVIWKYDPPFFLIHYISEYIRYIMSLYSQHFAMWTLTNHISTVVFCEVLLGIIISLIINCTLAGCSERDHSVRCDKLSNLDVIMFNFRCLIVLEMNSFQAELRWK